MDCNHIVGIIPAGDSDPEELVRKTTLDQRPNRMAWNLLSRFAFCPVCGKRVNDECDIK